MCGQAPLRAVAAAETKIKRATVLLTTRYFLLFHLVLHYTRALLVFETTPIVAAAHPWIKPPPLAGCE